MANMGYCRFRNTLADLRDCYENFDEASGDEEEAAREKLVKLCKRIVSDYDRDNPLDDSAGHDPRPSDTETA